MSAILNKYKRWKIYFNIILDKYYDFVLSLYNGSTINIDGKMNDNCLISLIDFSEPECIGDGYVQSISSFVYNKDITDETLIDIGLTGIDNGLIKYNKYEISNEDFLNLLTGSTFLLNSNLLQLRPVDGNQQIYNYPLEYNEVDGCYCFKGGFLQGFYKIDGFNYQTLPQYIEDEWNLEFVIRPRTDYTITNNTLNSTHPNNKGIFFYMGTRAENKFAQFYESDIENYKKDDIIGDCDNPDYIIREKVPVTSPYKSFWQYFLNEYGFSDINDYGCKICKKETIDTTCDDYFEIDENGNYYIIKEESILDKSITTSNGKLVKRDDYFELPTNNKYIIFDRTKNGFTVDTWDDNDQFTLTGYTPNYTNNLFLLMNRTKTGYSVNNIEEIISPSSKKYKMSNDSKGNAFALMINNDGSIGYRYAIDTCEEDFIKQEKSFPNIINKDKWNIINVKIKINGGILDNCGKSNGKRKLKLYIYVDGFLKFVSQELPEFRFRSLDEEYDKQEGVPFNISLGGGTQGLAESVWLDYYKSFPYLLPIEKYFAGSFIGDIKSFKFYNCPMEYNQIYNNYLYCKNGGGYNKSGNTMTIKSIALDNNYEIIFDFEYKTTAEVIVQFIIDGVQKTIIVPSRTKLYNTGLILFSKYATITNIVLTSDDKKYDYTYKNEIADGTFILTYILDGEIFKKSNVMYGTPLVEETAPVKVGYNFNGWIGFVDIMPESDLTIIGYYIAQEFIVKFYNNGLEIDRVIVSYGNSAIYTGTTPTKESTPEYNYIFNGWDKNLSVITADTNTTAVFNNEKVKYQLTFVTNEGITGPIQVAWGDNIEILRPTTPSYTENNKEYIFSAWDNTITIMPIADVIITAIYTENNEAKTIYYGAVLNDIIDDYTTLNSVEHNIDRDISISFYYPECEEYITAWNKVNSDIDEAEAAGDENRVTELLNQWDIDEQNIRNRHKYPFYIVIPSSILEKENFKVLETIGGAKPYEYYKSTTIGNFEYSVMRYYTDNLRCGKDSVTVDATITFNNK